LTLYSWTFLKFSLKSAAAEDETNNNDETNSDKSPRYNNSNNSHDNSGAMLSKTNLYIRGLAAQANDSYLYELCKEYGEIMSTKAIMDKNTNVCKGKKCGYYCLWLVAKMSKFFG